MALETLYADAHITGTFVNPNNAIGNTPTTWAGTINQVTSETSRWSIANPVNPLASGATHTITVIARKGSNTGNPSVAVTLFQNGTSIRQIASATVTSTTGQTVSGTFNTSEISDASLIEIQVASTGVGGNASTRNATQISYISAELNTEVAAPSVERSGSITGSSTLSGFGLRVVDRSGTISGISTLTGEGSSDWTTFSDGVSATAGATVTGLTNGVAYNFRVAAVNSEGQSAWSNVAGPYTPVSSGAGPVLKRWNGSTWVAAVIKHGSGWPTITFGGL